MKDVVQVEQGFINSKEESALSEAVIVHFDSEAISLKDLIEIHLYTHQSTSDHSMRTKYRSAVYALDSDDFEESTLLLNDFQKDFDNKLITKVHHFDSFKASLEQFHDYYYTDSNKPFCTTYIVPKLSFLLKKYGKITYSDKVKTSIAPEATSK